VVAVVVVGGGGGGGCGQRLGGSSLPCSCRHPSFSLTHAFTPPHTPPHKPKVHASADALRLITFDADGTLYADGAHMEQDSEMIKLIVSLMRLNVHVAIVTAAGYPVGGGRGGLGWFGSIREREEGVRGVFFRWGERERPQRRHDLTPPPTPPPPTTPSGRRLQV
jgi:hypothetical protein